MSTSGRSDTTPPGSSVSSCMPAVPPCSGTPDQGDPLAGAVTGARPVRRRTGASTPMCAQRTRAHMPHSIRRRPSAGQEDPTDPGGPGRHRRDEPSTDRRSPPVAVSRRPARLPGAHVTIPSRSFDRHVTHAICSARARAVACRTLSASRHLPVRTAARAHLVPCSQFDADLPALEESPDEPHDRTPVRCHHATPSAVADRPGRRPQRHVAGRLWRWRRGGAGRRRGWWRRWRWRRGPGRHLPQHPPAGEPHVHPRAGGRLLRPVRGQRAERHLRDDAGLGPGDPDRARRRRPDHPRRRHGDHGGDRRAGRSPGQCRPDQQDRHDPLRLGRVRPARSPPTIWRAGSWARRPRAAPARSSSRSRPPRPASTPTTSRPRWSASLRASSTWSAPGGSAATSSRSTPRWPWTSSSPRRSSTRRRTTSRAAGRSTSPRRNRPTTRRSRSS